MSRKTLLAILCSAVLAGSAALSSAPAFADSGSTPPIGDVDPTTGVVELRIGMNIHDVETDGTSEWTASPMAAGTKSFNGNFRASFTTGSVEHKGGDIKIIATPTNCTPGYPNIYIQLVKTTVLGIIIDTSPKVSFPCELTRKYTWTGRSAGTYYAYVSRAGGAGVDENMKNAKGTITYQAS